jgi:hypothetical protein
MSKSRPKRSGRKRISSNLFLVSALVNRMDLKMNSENLKGTPEPKREKEEEVQEREEELIVVVEEAIPIEDIQEHSLTHGITRSASMHFLTPTLMECVAANGDKVLISLEEFNALDSKSEDVYNEESDSLSLSDFSDDSDNSSTGEDITTFLRDYFDEALETK